MRDTLDFTFREDSLVLLHRSGPDAPWVKWADDVNVFSNPTDGYGRINLDSLRTGEYAFAWRKSPTSLEGRIAESANWTLRPNPAKGHVTVEVDMDPANGSLQLLDATGREVRTTPCSGRLTEIALDGLAIGSYTVHFIPRTGKRRFVGTLAVSP
ncbi:MAG: T9SS type A sorting domain-containing protein [Flavobacteriales bacterium]